MRLLSKPLKGCLGVILGITCVASLQAATFTTTFRQGVGGYTNTLDTDLNANEPDRVQGSDDQNLADLNAPIAQALIRFEGMFGTGPGQVPPGAIISSATLTLRTSNLGDLCRGFQVLVPWDETTTTWNTMTNGISADDIEMSSTVLFELDSVAVGDIFNFDVTTTVQDWFAGLYPNYGWGITNAGGDGWQFNSSEFATVDFRPMLTIVFDSPCVPISIVTQPANTTVNEGGSVTFTVTAGGTGVAYQWLRDGVPIQDATNANYTISRVFRADEGNYSVVLNNECSGPINSANAALNVIDDNTGPTVLAAYGTNDNVTLFVVFSEIVTNADRQNYTVFLTDDPATQLTVASATFGDPTAIEGRVVVLTLDPGTPWAPGQRYSISASAVFDLFGNPIDPGGVTQISLYNDTFFGIGTEQIWTFLDPRANPPAGWNTVGFNDSTWGSGPALLGVEGTALAEPLRTQLTLGGITYYFRTHFNYDGPAGNGVLRFRTMLDDSAVIYLNGVEIHRIRMPAGPVEYVTQGAGDAVGDAVYDGPYTVAVSNLVSGDNVLAVEVHQIGTGSSDIVWGMEFGAVTASIDAIAIVTQPVGTNVTEPTPFTLRVVASGSSPQYQWFLNGAQIDGATSSSYTVNPSDCDLHPGQYHVVVFNDAPSSVTSSTVTVGVTCDVTPPAIACVYGTNDVLVVVFNENVTMDWGTAVFNFSIRPPGGAALTLTSVTNTSGTNFGTTVLATIDPSTPRDPGLVYSVEISGVEDMFANAIAPITVAVPWFASSSPLLSLTAPWRYNTSGTDLGSAWSATGYNDSTWLQGPAPFDAKRPMRTNVGGILIGTQTTLSNAANTAQIPTHYFRTHFNYSGPPSATLELNAFVDDGAVYYLNGEEIFRVGLPAAPAAISYATLANRTTGDATNEFFHVCVDNLVNGDNVLAVEVHQVALDSSDLTFATQVSVYTATPPPPSARLTITRGAGNQINISWTGSGVLQESSNLATHPNGWSNVAGVVGNSYQTTSASGNRFFRLAPNP